MLFNLTQIVDVRIVTCRIWLLLQKQEKTPAELLKKVHIASISDASEKNLTQKSTSKFKEEALKYGNLRKDKK